MSVYRSYFSKNDTLVENNETNNSQNPVTELSYGTLNAFVSRFIFDINLQPLVDRIQQGFINPDTIQSHVLQMTNTIAYRPDLIGKKLINPNINQRTSSFDLELFTVTEDWDEGSGYEFVYDDEPYISVPKGVANWYERKTGVLWTEEGAFISGSSQILGVQHFEKGNENINIDITDYVNDKLNQILYSGSTGTTGGTLGIKFSNSFEITETLERQVVAFFTRKTNTFYVPHILTTFDNTIKDDRNYFYLDKDNELYLYVNVGSSPENVSVNNVVINDYLGNIVTTISGDSIQNVSLGVYKILLNIDSVDYPDAVIFTDTWNITQNGKQKSIEQEFYLISQNNYFTFNPSNIINFDNYFFNIIGIGSLETMKVGSLKNVKINIQQLYPNQENNLPLDIDYRVYNTQSDKYEIDVIPWTKVDRTSAGYGFVLDTSWLIPQDYYLELRMNSGNLFQKKSPLRFTVVSDGVTGA